MPPPAPDNPPPDAAEPHAHRDAASGSRGSGSDDEPTRVTRHDSRSDSGATTPVVPLGPSIEGYALKEELHRGGQGIVYRAIQLGTKRQVALKVMLEGPFASETTRRRFEREIELAASLRHPNIVTILDSGLSQDRYFFAMEYIDGVRLDRYVAQQRPSLTDVLRLFEKVCLAVNYAHQRGVIHRDLKPPNILVDADGEPRILDFGLAKPVHAVAASESTVRMLSTSGQLLGTIAYMSPEQAAGSLDVDVRSDVYSLGVIFYEALTGHPPYNVTGPLAEVLARISQDDPISPRGLGCQSSAAVTIDDETATILLKALAKEPFRRYQTAGELARDWRRRLLGEPIEAKRASGWYMLKKSVRRYRWQATAASAGLTALLVFLVSLAVLLGREREARRRADRQAEETRVAVRRQEEALVQARERTAEAMLAQQNLRRALVRQHIQRGDLALGRGDLHEARDSYWQAFEVAPGPATMWALRRYYVQTSEDRALPLNLGVPGLGQLSPDGALAAVCPTADTIAVREVQSGKLLNWMRAPGSVMQLNLNSSGALAAVGDGWGRAWRPGANAPAVAVQLPEGARTHAVYVLSDGRELLALWHRSVDVYGGARGEQQRTTPLRGSPRGPGDYVETLRKLAVPTTAGVELVDVPVDGPVTARLVWTGPASARTLRFDGDSTLAVLADAIYLAPVASLTDEAGAAWSKFSDAAPDWDLFDLKADLRLVVFGTRAGRLAVYRDGQPVGTLHNAVERLEALRLSVDERAVVTLDDRGTLAYFGEPTRVEQRRLIHGGAAPTWAAAADGSAVLLAAGRGQVLAYAPAASPEPRTVLRPRLLDLGDEELALALSGDGGRAVIRDRGVLRFVMLGEDTTRTVRWADPAYTVPERVALSTDGELAAVLARNVAGDRQQVAWRRWDEPGEPPGRFEAAPFGGSVVRDIVFVPGTHRLLVSRSSGELLLIEPRLRREPDERPPVPEAWLQLDSPPTRVAFNRTGEYLAAACEDGIVRLVSVVQREVRKRLPVGRAVSALSFNPHDDVLLIRTADGTIRLFDPATGESLATWRLPAATATPLAAWIGERADAMLLSYETGVYEYRYAAANAIMEQNRPCAHEQRAAHALADADLNTAWRAAGDLRNLSPGRGTWAQLAVLEAALRRTNFVVPPAWLAALESVCDGPMCLRLGAAAYDGERFELARTWLHAAYDRLDGALDARSLAQLAATDYLAQDHDHAADELAAVAARPDLEPAQAPLIALQRVAALLLAKRNEEARAVAARIGDPDPWNRRGDLVATTYAGVTARVIAGIERQSAVATLVDSVLGSLGPRAADFREDEYFFAGELARLRGDAAQAAVQYQRCLDLARDTWPANWARYRLRHLNPPGTAG
jgi:predicted Ser/Thr protein kinase